MFLPVQALPKGMVQLMYEDIEKIKDALGKLAKDLKYDLIILDTGAGISESVLQFNLFANKNVIVLNETTKPDEMPQRSR